MNPYNNDKLDFTENNAMKSALTKSDLMNRCDVTDKMLQKLDGNLEDGDKRKNFQIGPRIEEDEIWNGEGCRLIVTDKRPMLAFHRKMDGVRKSGWKSRRWSVKHSGSHRKSFQIAKCLDQYEKKRRTEDWNRSGVPGKWETNSGTHNHRPKY